MEQSESPSHRDRHKSAFNFTLILALVVMGLGIYGVEPAMFLLGLAFAAYSWFTTPSQYSIFQDRLQIAYGRPRVKRVPFRQASGQVELLKLPIGNRVLVGLANGRRIVIQPRDPDEFKTRLERAIDSYRRDHPGDPSPP